MPTLAQRRRRRDKRRLEAIGIPQDVRSEAIRCGEWRNVEAEAGEQLATVSMVAYSGGRLFVGGFKHPVVVDLQGLEVNARANLLLDHNPQQRVGHPENIRVERNQIVAEGVLSAATSHRDEVVASARNGFGWHVSIGARVIQAELIRQGQRVRVNGQDFTGPVIVARRAKLNEISFVGSGGDEGNEVRIAAESGAETMNPFEKWLEAQGLVLAELSEEAQSNLRAAYDALQANNNTSDDTSSDSDSSDSGASATADDDSELAVAAATAASQDIAAVYDRQGWVNEHLTGHPNLQAQAMREGWNQDRIQLEGLRAQRSSGPAVHTVDNNLTQAALNASMCVTHGVQSEDEAAREYGEQAVEASRNRRVIPSQPSLRWLAHSLIRAHGGHAHPGEGAEQLWAQAKAIDYQNWQAYLRAGGDGASLQAASGFSSISLSGTLSNLANKSLLAGYRQPRTVRDRFCRQVSNSDFKQSSKYRVTMANFLSEVPASGEIEHTELTEDTYTNQLKTYARMIGLTRQMIINDDLNAFAQLATLMGQNASKTLERAVMTLLLANTGTFFNSSATVAANNHLPNALTGAGSALAPASLEDAETLFLEQVDREGSPIMIEPSFILVPPALKRTVENLIEKRTINVTNTASDPELRVESSFSGDFDHDYSPWVGANGGLGGTDTNWWMFGRPQEAAVMEIAYLNSRRAPIIENSEADFNVLGMQWRVYHDWGIAYEDPRAGVYAPGA